MTIEVHYAPLVFARTAYLDFRPDFLGAPESLKGSDRARTRDLVLASLDYAEKLEGGPRWVLFRAGDHLIAGAAAGAHWLSDELTHELNDRPDGKAVPRRRLHAFAGAVFEGAATPFAPPRSQEFYGRIYDEVARPRFLERLSSTDWQSATPTRFRSISVEPVPASGALPPAPQRVRIFPERDDERLWRAVAAGRGEPSFCTGVPSGRYAQHRLFDVLTRADADAPTEERRTEPREARGDRDVRAGTRANDPAMDVTAWDVAQKTAQGRGGSWFGLDRLMPWRGSGRSAPAAPPVGFSKPRPVGSTPAPPPPGVDDWAGVLAWRLGLGLAEAEALRAAREPLGEIVDLARRAGRNAGEARNVKPFGKIATLLKKGAQLVVLKSAVRRGEDTLDGALFVVVEADRDSPGGTVLMHGDTGSPAFVRLEIGDVSDALRADARIVIVDPPRHSAR